MDLPACGLSAGQAGRQVQGFLYSNQNDHKRNLMSESPQIPHAEEISLFELFEILWAGKWRLAGFMALALVLAGVYLIIKGPVYESKLIYSAEKLPYFIDADEAYADFRQMLFSENIFKDWEKTNPKIIIPFEYISVTEIVDSFIITKEENKKLMTVGLEKGSLNRDRPFMLVKSSKPDILPTADYLYLYMQHINMLLTARQLKMAEDALVIIETRFKDYSAINDSVVNNTLAIDRYIKSVEEEGARALTIFRPTLPKKAVSTTLIFVLTVITGGIIGVFYVFLQNAIRRYKAETGMAT